jgi:tetratricopeptide (TPR) repeat protein
MRWQSTRVLILVAGLGLAAGCGKYSINNLRATQAFQTGNMEYQRGEWESAIAEYNRAVTFNPDLGYAYFFMGNSYDNLYRPMRRGEPDNDAYLDRAVENYRLAIEKLKDNDEPQAGRILELSYEYLIAAYGTDKLNDIDQAVPVAQDLIATQPNEPSNYQALGKLYEENGLYEEAEEMFLKAIEVKTDDPLSYEVLAGYYARQGEFAKSMDALQRRADMEPNNPEAWHTLGARYSEEALKNTSLSRAEAQDMVMKGIEAEDRALAINPDYFEALAFKNILLRQQANYETNPARQQQLLSEADTIRARASELQKKQGGATGQ